MLKFSHSNLTFISGTVWMVIGIFLLQLGCSLLLTPQVGAFPLRAFFESFTRDGAEAAILIMTFALSLGFLKGKFVLRKAAVKGVARICAMPNPTAIYTIYNGKYCLLLCGMVLLGISIKYLGIPNDIRGAIDIAVGSALINGAVGYYRMGWNLRQAY